MWCQRVVDCGGGSGKCGLVDFIFCSGGKCWIWCGKWVVLGVILVLLMVVQVVQLLCGEFGCVVQYLCVIGDVDVLVIEVIDDVFVEVVLVRVSGIVIVSMMVSSVDSRNCISCVFFLLV